MFGSYIGVLRTPAVSPGFVAVFLSAVTLGMMNLTIVLLIGQWSGSLSAAGVISGVFSIGNAVGLTIQGSLIDRFGSRRVIAVAGGLCAAALVLFVAAGTNGGPLWVIGALVMLAGLAVPAVTAAVRAWLPLVLAGSARNTSYALLSVLFQAAVTVGPLLVSLCLIAGTIEDAGVTAAAVIAAATILYLSRRSPDERQQRSPRNVERTRPRGGVPAGLLTILGSAATVGAVSGVLIVALPAIAVNAGAVALSGVLFAVLAFGEVVGALIYGIRSWTVSYSRQLFAAQLLAATMFLTLTFLAGWPYALLPAMFLCGMAIAPVSILLSALLDNVLPPRGLARGYSLLVATSLGGTAAGTAAAGYLAETMQPAGLLLVPPTILILAASWSALRHRTLKPDQP